MNPPLETILIDREARAEQVRLTAREVVGLLGLAVGFVVVVVFVWL